MSVQVSDLSFQYNPKTTFRFPDMDLAKGSHQLILGNSGKGKTTFLHLLAGILSPSSGKIIIGEQDITTLKSRKLDHFRGKNIGLIFQRSYFVKSLTVKDNLLLAQKLAGKPEDLNRITEVLTHMNMQDKLHKMPSNLSIGEQQRISIARAVINSPELILADEPTSALDDENAKRVAQLLEETASDCNANLIVVTHDQRLKDHYKNVIEL
ncbi:ABC-type antimicrobial peptide transport system, ATPase component [Owenweeksia hongkongensis DSM 17368]|uniref:ABC-type antimicrobial peptide transport system, ATPase component n=1 Tax=Owenweeksia hongkongensis (strain DSM 17368 / CIP 108786 / JCM 12287 / NRRL B-23963 / UST20020801) TaxID=926562 RepID=G8R769_OWEHD|nr:ATP-binding cassette domain-containing protein [Owenweeksia hongkongensis]AEV34476.1 ABC-type antimicrobial peptide transport system, ATPase component [Owenweeksia hongkongensis DSM 17368]